MVSSLTELVNTSRSCKMSCSKHVFTSSGLIYCFRIESGNSYKSKTRGDFINFNVQVYGGH